MGCGYMEVGFAGNLGKGKAVVVISAYGAQERNRPMKALGALPYRKALLFRSLRWGQIPVSFPSTENNDHKLSLCQILVNRKISYHKKLLSQCDNYILPTSRDRQILRE